MIPEQTATREQCDAYVASLTDAELLQRTEQAYQDTRQASEDDWSSEWHSSCFAALYLFCTEMSRRGLKRPPSWA